MAGWIKVHRKLLDKPIWQLSSPEQKTILMTLLLMANFESCKWEWQGKPYECLPGQFVTSLDNIVKKCGKGITLQNVRTALKRFENLEFLTNESTKTGRFITIVNWGDYQAEDARPNIDVNKDLTNSQQSTNKDLTPSKNVKNDKNVKNNNTSRFTPPAKEEVENYCLERKNNVDAEQFIDFYSAKGWMVGKNKMKDWKACVRTWEKRDSTTSKPNKTNKFNDFPQRDYKNINDIEKALINKGL